MEVEIKPDQFWYDPEINRLYKTAHHVVWYSPYINAYFDDRGFYASKLLQPSDFEKLVYIGEL